MNKSKRTYEKPELQIMPIPQGFAQSDPEGSCVSGFFAGEPYGTCTGGGNPSAGGTCGGGSTPSPNDFCIGGSGVS